MEKKPTLEELAHITQGYEPTEEECDRLLDECVANGTLEITGVDGEGNRLFRLTPKGTSEANAIFKGAREDLAMQKGLQ